MFRKLKRYFSDPYYEIGCDILKYCPKIMSDKWWISTIWQMSRGYKLNWENPTTYNEKLQWLKLYDRNPLYTTLVDKYDAKKWLADKYGVEYVVPTIGIYQSTKEICYDKLPEQFVIKCTHDSGSTFICKDKNNFDWQYVCQKLENRLKFNFYYEQREWMYKKLSRRIIIEPLLLSNIGKIPNDFKCFFINGNLEFIYVSYDREGVNDRCVYDRDWNRLPFVYVSRCDYRSKMNISNVSKPKSLHKMIEIGSSIAQLFKTVRVDFYEVDGKLLLGEITLFHGGGSDSFFPEKYDLYYGKKLKLE